MLSEVGAFLRSNTRGEDIACRYGSEELAVMLAGASLKIAVRRAEQL